MNTKHLSTCSLLTLLAVLLSGCGPANYRPPAASNPELAKKALVEVLEAWKSGAKPEALRSESPPVYVADEQWLHGQQLAGYELQGEGTLFGTNVRFNVLLHQKGSRPGRKQALYVVATEPVVSVSRSDVVE